MLYDRYNKSYKKTEVKIETREFDVSIFEGISENSSNFLVRQCISIGITAAQTRFALQRVQYSIYLKYRRIVVPIRTSQLAISNTSVHSTLYVCIYTMYIYG